MRTCDMCGGPLEPEDRKIILETLLSAEPLSAEENERRMALYRTLRSEWDFIEGGEG